jgi:hypothetical protein
MKRLTHAEVWNMAIDAARTIVSNYTNEARISPPAMTSDQALDAISEAIGELLGQGPRQLRDARKVWRLVELEKQGFELCRDRSPG